MPLLYDIGARSYHLAIKLAAPFNSKARKWVDGRKGLFDHLSNTLSGVEGPIWIHCSSYGEYEQGKPIIDGLKKKYPEKRIVLTFYSPSGFEAVAPKEKDLMVFYLPSDGRSNATRFLEIVRPSLAVFIKYEFWYHYLNELNERAIPTYLVSALFQEDQTFFKWYGSQYRKMLEFFTMILVQDENSVTLLQSIGVLNSIKTGDTRFDRVHEVASLNESSEILDQFTDGAENVLVAGSTWPKDEEILSKYFNSDNTELKLIIAPHEVNTDHIRSLSDRFKIPVGLYSNGGKRDARVMIIDSLGILSRAYRYGTVSYVGGGFNGGIHNILEPAAYGLPIVFGPDHHRFKEAQDLLTIGGANSIKDQKDLNEVFGAILKDQDLLASMSQKSKDYVQENRGATSAFLTQVSELEIF